MLRIRCEEEREYREVESLTREAFWNVYRPGCSEHLVLHRLRKAAAFVPELDCVAEADGRIVGHIAYARMFRAGDACADVVGFGPISVLPEWQRRGVGALLIDETLKRARELGFRAVLITGNPAYYGRFGFVPASRFGVHLAGVSPEEEAPFFMAKELEPGALTQHAGVYAFDAAYEVTEAELAAFDAGFPTKVKREPRPDDL